MKLTRPILTLLFLLNIASSAAAADDTGKNLAKFAKDPAPWLHMEANSEQRQPLYLGATPREIALRRLPADRGQAILYEVLRERGEAQMRQVRDALVSSGAMEKGSSVEFEMWPAPDDYGQLTWVIARWRLDRGRSWQRLNAAILPENPDPYLNRWPVLPLTLNPAKREDFSLIFDDALTLKTLHSKPLFGDCVWATTDGIALDAWLPVEQREAFGIEVAEDVKKMGSTLVCRVLPQPARLNGKPITFIVGLDGSKAAWPESIQWKEEEASLPGIPQEPALIKEWPAGFLEKYREDLLALDGEKEAVFPASKRKMFFTKKNSADKDNQLRELVAYLEERYRELGIKTWRQDFSWRGIKQSNLIAVIPGSDPSLKPVLMADHIDTAFCEDIFEESGGPKRVSSPGAGDDCAATAALLGSAPILRDLKLRRDVWLVHLTGEEFPADSLGSRHFASQLLKDKQDVEGVVLLDMIGRRGKKGKVLQISPGDSPESLKLAKASLDAAKRTPGLEPVVRTRFDKKSHLYNTDGAVFSDAGFPVVVLSEGIDFPEKMRSKGYHYSADVSANIDWAYASDIAKAAVEAAAAIANMRPADRPVDSQPEWSIVTYIGVDEPDVARAYNPRLKDVLEAPVPDNVEVLIERDTEWPDGSARIMRRSDSHEESEIAEQNSANAQTFYNFLKWANAKAKGKKRLLIVHGLSWGWRGMIRDSAIPGEQGKKAVMPLSEMARAVRESGFRPDVIFFDAGLTGNVESIGELKDLAPYLVVSELETPFNGFPAERLFRMAGESDMDSRKLAKRIPEEYVKEYARDGAMAGPEKKYFIATLAAVDTAKWSAFTARFKELAEALARTDFRKTLAAQPGWLKAFADGNANADLVEFLNRLPLLVNDPDSKRLSAAILDDIGYPDRIAAENAATITLDPAKIRSFELRIEAYPHSQRPKALEDTRGAWKALNQDLNLPETLTYDLHDFQEKREPRREFAVRAPDGALKKPVTFRPWLAGAKYFVLTTVDKDGQASTRKLFKDKDYITVSDFPETSFLVSEAHDQGAPFIHGIGIAVDTGAIAGVPQQAPYSATSWNRDTGWGDLVLAESGG